MSDVVRQELIDCRATSEMEKPRDGTRVLIVSAHRIFRECLATMLQFPSVLACAFATAEDEALRKIAEDAPDVILIDHYGQAESTMLELTSRLRRESPGSRLLLIGDREAENQLTKYIEAGAAGFITNGRSMLELLDAIHCVVEYEAECSPEQVAIVFARLQQLSQRKDQPEEISTSDLTVREIEILKLIDAGHSNKQIASELHLSIHTVKTHVHHILEKAGASNRRHAVYLAYQKGWLHNDS